jgi:glycosyltransferase involved in cell wall biosynthesis
MPVFNGAVTVAEAVESVQRQEHVELELLIHDDGSTDDTAAVLERLASNDPRIDVSRTTNRGPAAARNRLLERARGTFIAFLDHDDLWPTGRLARQRDRLEASPAAPGVLGETLLFDALDGEGAPSVGGQSRRVLAGLLQAGLFRQAAIASAGPFAEGFRTGDDFDFLLRLIENSGPLETESAVAVCYRQHPGQWTGDLALSGQGTVRALARSLKRRRAAGMNGPIDWRTLR